MHDLFIIMVTFDFRTRRYPFIGFSLMLYHNNGKC